MKRNPPNLGQTPANEGMRDAVHVSVIAMTAGAELKPSQLVGVYQGTAKPMNRPIGMVDPFREDVIHTGDLFWMFMLPGTVTDLRHEWSHPDITESEAIEAEDTCQGCW